VVHTFYDYGNSPWGETHPTTTNRPLPIHEGEGGEVSGDFINNGGKKYMVSE